MRPESSTSNDCAQEGHIRDRVAIGYSGYVTGCRCSGCVQGYRDYRREYSRKVRSNLPKGRKKRVTPRNLWKDNGITLTPDYVAGFFDGEGSVGVYHGNYSGYVRTGISCNMSNTHLPVLIAIQRKYGGRLHEKPSTYVSAQPMFVLCFGRDETYTFLKDILSCLVIKKAQAEIAIEYIEWMRQPLEVRCERSVAESAGGNWIRKPEVFEQGNEFVRRLKMLKRLDYRDLFKNGTIDPAADT